MPTTMFLRLDGITGESSDANHRGEIAIESVEWGLEVPGASTANTTSKPVFRNLSLAKRFDRSSPVLALHAAQQRPIASATLAMRSPASAALFLVYKMKTLKVASYATSVSTNDLPRDQFHLTYGSVEIEYFQIDSNGRVPASPTSKATFDVANARFA